MSPTPTRTLNARRSVIAAFGLYLAWTGVTWLLEGRINTLGRPNAALDRLTYAVAANLVVGILGATWLIRFMVMRRVTSAGAAGFTSLSRTIVSSTAALALGIGYYRLADGPAVDPVIIANAFAQVVVVSTAEVLVCWSVAGSIVESVSRHLPRPLALVIAIAISSVLFGLYHFAHSPPFNTVGMVIFLGAVGVVTGMFFFTSRNIYGTIVFHNVLGVLGVTKALAAKDALRSLSELQVPVLLTALFTVLVIVTLDVFMIRRAAPR